MLPFIICSLKSLEFEDWIKGKKSIFSVGGARTLAGEVATERKRGEEGETLDVLVEIGLKSFLGGSL